METTRKPCINYELNAQWNKKENGMERKILVLIILTDMFLYADMTLIKVNYF